MTNRMVSGALVLGGLFALAGCGVSSRPTQDAAAELCGSDEVVRVIPEYREYFLLDYRVINHMTIQHSQFGCLHDALRAGLRCGHPHDSRETDMYNACRRVYARAGITSDTDHWN
jgi:hypothetical protein